MHCRITDCNSVDIVERNNSVLEICCSAYIATREFNLFNIGWHVGGGAEWTIAGNTKLLFELNYLGTFLDIDKIRSYKDDNTPTNTSTLNPGIRLNDISLKVGVIF